MLYPLSCRAEGEGWRKVVENLLGRHPVLTECTAR